jgi:hypothetical protein
MPGSTNGAMSAGRSGSVVVVVVVVVVSPGNVVVVVVNVVVVVVVEVLVVVSPGSVVVVVVGAEGHDAEATFGRFTRGFPLLPMVVFVSEGFTVVVTPAGEAIVVSGGNDAMGKVSIGVVSTGSIASASVSAGAAAGGVLCSQISNLSTTGPKPLLRAHEAMFCCSGSLGCANT